MANLALGYAEFAVGAILVTAGLSKSHSIRDVLSGASRIEDTTKGLDAIPGGQAIAPPPASPYGTGDVAGPPSPSPGSGAYGFVGDPGKNFTAGEEPQIVARLNTLAQRLHVHIYGISGYRTPQHSVEVGGFADDPHTRGQAVDIGVNAQTLASASQITDAQLASVGLWRPFKTPGEVNHIELAGQS